MNQDLEEAKKELLKASYIWDIYKINFGEEYAIAHTHYTRKMFEDDMEVIRTLESEFNETAPG